MCRLQPFCLYGIYATDMYMYIILHSEKMIVNCDTISITSHFSNIHVIHLQTVLVAGSTRPTVWYFIFYGEK
jgi:hypothetical protein